jgi:Rrf2 family nitric oxide-sensitive transcriptional repressor
MQLTLFSDYALRVALYLATNPERLVPVAEISSAYGISHAHLVKVAQRLSELGAVEAVRGRTGGIRLARPPAEIRVGALVRATEPNFNLVECFDRKTNSCPIEPVCSLKSVLFRAKEAFLATLDGYTLADLLPQPQALVKVWTRRARSRPP